MACSRGRQGSTSIRIVSDMADKPIRVDNWGNFLAQRIEALYDKQEHCDLTLRFPHADLKAHSLILHACTPFFTNLLKGKTSGPKILKMPPQISSTAMGIILKFVYTGRLDAPFSVDMLYSTAKLLKLQILIRLLEAQMSSAEASVSAGLKTRRGRPPLGYHQPRSPGQKGPGYQTNSQLAASRRIIRAAEPPEDARPSRFEMPESDDLGGLGLPDPTLMRPKVEPLPEPAGSGDAMFEHLRQTPVKRPVAAPAADSAPPKRPKLEPAEPAEQTVDDPRGDEREYYEQQQERARLVEGGGAQPAEPSTPSRPRPILKQEPTPSTGSGKKRVQFSESSQLTLTVQDMGDTSELVSQLLKQHPELLQGGQSVKVRLVTQTGPGSPTHTEFMVVKQQEQDQEQAAVAIEQSESLETPLSCSLCARRGKQADFWWADQMAKHFQEEHSDESVIDLNTLSCTACVQAGDPIDFATVMDYFAHLRDVHDTRGVRSAGSCHLCGFSATKKLQLIYHEYTKHGIPPPRFITFPKCDRCDFEAISDSEMARHRQRRHKIGKEYKCKECGVVYQSLNLLEGHMRTNACRQGVEPKRKFDWKCELCGMSFSRSYNLKGHMRSVHKVVSTVADRRRSQPPDKPDAALRPEATISLPASLDPSSEAESMSTVANSVATSLSLAVDGEYMTLPAGIVPVEDENGVISYIALQPAEGHGAGAGTVVSDGTVLEVTEYTVPVTAVSGGGGVASVDAGSGAVRVAPAAGDPGPGASAGETVLPDLQQIDPPQTTESQMGHTLVSPQKAKSGAQLGSRSTASPRRSVTHSPGVGSSRISVSSSQVTVSELDEPASILPHLPGETLPTVVSQAYGQPVSLAQLRHGQFVMTDHLPPGHVIVSELASGQEVIVADMSHSQLYELQQSHGQQLIAQSMELSAVEHDDAAAQQLPSQDGLLSQPVDQTPHHVIVSQAGGVNQASIQKVDVEDTDCQQSTGDGGARQEEEVVVPDLSHSDEFIGPDSVPEEMENSAMPAVNEVDDSVTTGDVGQSNALTIQEGDLTVQQDQDGEATPTISGDIAEENVIIGDAGEEVSVSEDRAGLVVEESMVECDQDSQEHSQIDDSVVNSTHEETAVSQAHADSEVDMSVAHFPATEEITVSEERTDAEMGESVANCPPGEGISVSEEPVVYSQINESVAHYPADKEVPAASEQRSVETELEVEDSFIHSDLGDETTVSQGHLGDEVDESVAHFPAEKELPASNEERSEETELEIEDSLIHSDLGDETAVSERHLGHGVDESVAHYPAEKQEAASNDQRSEETALEVEDSFMHSDLGDETTVSEGHLGHEVDESVAHYPAGDETVVSDQPAGEPECVDAQRTAGVASQGGQPGGDTVQLLDGTGGAGGAGESAVVPDTAVEVGQAADEASPDAV
ncbi:Centrosome-associated zinc finger protein CP190 [Amphibalanus amphitrite]|uniref:Centrosome-associated zinc finger protein CP190 n=1 Tax=Amphibalanus amphitrite TaxID=1232801 RepID=A0A6A4WMI4_AMPAM|nr:Centrosome-associated zinc finger protein CP190 [Amphibalanus amphitrite]